jgi:hypothetical protein
MAFALFTTGLQGLMARLQKLFGGAEGGPPQQAPAAGARRSARPATRPLRVVHSGHGRLVISGRLADVCAELDRLAALEAAQGLAPAR